ncbi:MAG: alanine--glyoxylate aminotransferase family protein, partial [Spirochaetaceae bacterium]|nr:alanine--glyoxylate aminotransferase family protein [Spirochaetaceae bacterium]
MGITVIEHEWAESVDLNRVEDELKKDKDISLISMVFHETSTGMVNPVHEVGMLAKKYDKMFHVDTVSAIGGEDIDVVRDNIDFCNGVPNKAVGGQTGVAFVIVRRTALTKIEKVKRRNIYLNLQHHVREAETHNQTPNTPSVVMFITLNEALKVLFEEGQDNVIARYKENAAIIRKGMKDLGLRFLLDDEKLMSNTVTSCFLPEGINVDDFLDRMDSEGYVLYKGKGPLIDKNLFQAANMGQIHADDSREFINVLGRILADMSKG